MANIALVVGALVILAVVIFLIARLMSVIDKNSIKGGESYAEEKQALVAERLQKIGTVKVASAAAEGAASAAPRSAESIVNGVCASCHGTGVLGAPKLKDSADWAPRFALGLSTMIDHAKNGINSMPPKGGDATLSDEELRSAVVLMLKDAGQNVADDPAPAEAAAPAVETAAPAAEVVAEVKETAAAAVEAVTTAVAETAEAATETAGNLLNSAGESVTSAAGAAVAAVADAPKASAEVAATPAATADFTRGKAMYKQACFSCHDNGVAGAPKTGDIAAWETRIAAGMNALYAAAINGKGAMPPKGGRIDAGDDVIRETVDYMVSLSGG